MNARARIAAFFGRSAARGTEWVRVPVAVPPRADGSGAPASRPPAAAPSLFALAAVLFALLLALATPASADTLPTIAGEQATDVGVSSARLSAEVNPNGTTGDGPTDWQIQYSLAGADHGVGGDENWSFANASTIAGQAAEESNPVGVEAILFGLVPDTEYEFRVTAANAAGTAQTATPHPTFATDAPAEPVLTVTAITEVTSDSAHLTGTVNPAGGNFNPVSGPNPEPIHWQFEVSRDGGSSWRGMGGLATIEGSAAEGSADVVVEADAVGNFIQPNKEHLVRLTAFWLGFSRQAFSPAPHPSFTTEGVPPVLSEPGNTPLGQGTMGVGAYVNPGNSALTECRVEYGLSDGYGQSAACPAVPVNNDPNVTGVQLEGLTPGATYHYRFLASNAHGDAQSEDHVFRVYAEPEGEGECPNEGALGTDRLPECRAWEMVSPPDKRGGNISGVPKRMQASRDGSAIRFNSLRNFTGETSASIATDYIASRTPNPARGEFAWRTHSITPDQPSLHASLAFAFLGPVIPELSPDLDSGIFMSYGSLGDADPEVSRPFNLYRLGGLDGPAPHQADLVTRCPRCVEAGTELPAPILGSAAQRGTPRVAAYSPDFRLVAFNSVHNLHADAPAQSFFCNPAKPVELKPPFTDFTGITNCMPRAYEWDDGTLYHAGILPDGSPAAVSVISHGNPPFTGGRFDQVTPNAIAESADGHIRTVFTQPTDASGTPLLSATESQLRLGNLYIREDHQRTIKLNESERTDCAGDPTCGGDDQPDPAPAPFRQAEFWWASPGGARYVFTSRQALTDDAKSGDAFAYMYDATLPPDDPHNLTLINVDPVPDDVWTTRVSEVVGISDDGEYVYFVNEGPLTRGSGPRLSLLRYYVWHDGEITEISLIKGFREFNLNDGRIAKISPDGRHLLLSMGKNQPATDVLSPRGGFDYSGILQQLYLYDAEADTLLCASCPTDSHVAGEAKNEPPAVRLGGDIASGAYENRSLSSDGRYVYFSTADALVPADVNGTWDAYQFDAETGRHSLLSSGESLSGSYFVDTGADRRDIFILTAEPLSRWDVDGAYDVYDARRNGGAPEPEPARPACQGDSCQPPPLALADATPASEGYAAPPPTRQRRRATCRVRVTKKAAKKGAKQRRRATKAAEQRAKRCRKKKRSRQGRQRAPRTATSTERKSR